MSKRCLNVLLGTVSLILGGLLYILLRGESYVAQIASHFLHTSGLQSILTTCNCEFLKYYLPDFLWGFSLCCGLIAIHAPSIRGIIICGAAVFLCGSLWETAQYFDIVSGTGDFIDMAMYLTAGLAGILLNLRERVK